MAILPILTSILLACAPAPTAHLPAQRSGLDLEKLLVDVFDPQRGEKVLVMVDMPHGAITDNEAWAARRDMADEWRAAFQKLARKRKLSGRTVRVYPLLTYAATGAHNSPLPEEGMLDGKTVRLETILADTDIAVAMTEYSATASLSEFTQRFPRLRAASMPTVARSMEQTALAADYAQVALRAHLLADRLDRAEGAEVVFSTGHRLHVDLRDRHAHADDGQLHADKQEQQRTNGRSLPAPSADVHSSAVINLPSGEAYIAPSEGELPDRPSRTEGMIPMPSASDPAVVVVQQNRAVEVQGEGSAAAQWRAWFAADPARTNLAELGLGCNDRAVVTGNVLEDEKVQGVHLAWGRSDHLGGAVGVDDFADPAHVVHLDVVYPNGSPVSVASLVLEYADGTREEIIRDGASVALE